MSRESANEADFAEFYRRNFRYVYAYCLRRTSPDRADDVVAETFLVAWRRLDDVPPADSELPWLYGVAYKVLSTHWRTNSRQRRLASKLESIGAKPMTGTEDFVVTAEESAQVIEALSNLKPTDQEILKLSVWEELAHAEIALALGISVGAVKQRGYQARKNLTREYKRIEKKRLNPLAAEKGGRT